MTLRGARPPTLAERQGLPPAAPFRDAGACARSLSGLRASEATTPYLSLRARCARFEPDALERWFSSSRWVRVRAMRGTLFCGPADVCGDLVRATRPVGQRFDVELRRRGLTTATYGRIRRGVLGALERGPLPARTLAAEQPAALGAPVRAAIGTMLARGDVVSRIDGRWTAGFPRRYRGDERDRIRPTIVALAPFDVGDDDDQHRARLGLLESYLAAYGPATVADAAWWTSFGKRATATMLAELGRGRRARSRDDGRWDAPRARGPAGTPREGACLLPGGDALVKAYADLRPLLDDPANDVRVRYSPSAWLDGRLVATWGYEATTVWLRPLPGVALGRAGRASLSEEALDLARWLGFDNPRVNVLR